ncbi:Protein indeterminate-domain 7 [Linum perenne]
MMMMKSFIFQNQQQQQQQEENMSNLTTSASGTEASVSSSGTNTNRDHNYGHHPPPDIPSSAHPPAKKKRNMPGNPDPDSEVISLSPKTLMATNRFLCEICNKGFQRDQNLQLHRRGHNLPWKLKQRNKDEVVRRKVYVCPEPSCVHHDPSRALGDLTGIKKHFSRKHGEKKWKCDKCSKKYAVQSDWKAHSKTCGTREYRCDCGTLFSRRDSFITHRAFCDALAEESARAIPPNNTMSAPPPPSPLMNLQPAVPQFNSSNVMNHHPTQEDNSNSHMNLQYPFSPSLKKEHQQQQHQPCYNSQSGGNFGMLMNNIRAAQQPGSAELPPWLASCPSSGLLLGTRGPPHHPSSSPSSSSPSILSASTAAAGAGGGGGRGTSPNPSQMGPTTLTLPNFQTAAAAGAPHMSATALLQKAAQMGSSSSSTNTTKTAGLHTGPHHNHVSNNNNLGFNFSSSRPPVHQQQQIGGGNFFQEMMNYSGGGGFEEDEDGMASFEDAFGGGSKSAAAAALGDGTGGSEGMTRDFLGLRPLSHSDLLSLAGFGHCINDDVPPPDQQQQQQQQQHNSHNHESLKPWQGN